MSHFVKLNQLNKGQLRQYSKAIENAFPKIIGESAIIKKYWSKLEHYFPEHQQFLLSSREDIVGFINTVPFYFNDALDQLPDNGWDWMLTKGLSDFENKQVPNYLGGLQVIVREDYQKLGYSKKIINHCKEHVASSTFSNLIIPIRPTKKHLFPKMSMEDYIKIKNENQIFDPWIRTHLKGGAEIIKICEQSMTVEGNIDFWERLFNKKIIESGEHILKGALKPISIDLQNNIGVYKEPNIWIKYD